jgi:hypothetical protein
VKLGRRPWFFLAIAAIFVLMLIPTPAEFRWLNLVMAGLAVVWAVLLGAEEVLAERAANRGDATPAAADEPEGEGP